jgi:hypothetical protein
MIANPETHQTAAGLLFLPTEACSDLSHDLQRTFNDGHAQDRFLALFIVFIMTDENQVIGHVECMNFYYLSTMNSLFSFLFSYSAKHSYTLPGGAWLRRGGSTFGGRSNG